MHAMDAANCVVVWMKIRKSFPKMGFIENGNFM